MGERKRRFRVIDRKTGREPDYDELEEIVLHEEWAKGLVYCDLDSFAVCETGGLVLLDECGNWREPPAGRFEVVFTELDDG